MNLTSARIWIAGGETLAGAALAAEARRRRLAASTLSAAETAGWADVAAIERALAAARPDLVFVAAGVIAILLGFSPKFGAVIGTIPVAVLGGLAVVVFGLIAATAGRIWVENKVDFAQPKNLLTVATALILGAGDLKLPIFGYELGGIGTATFAAIALYHLLDRRKTA